VAIATAATAGERYQVILTDPPWSYSGDQGKWGAAAKFYPTMSEEELASLPISAYLARPGVMFVWATGPKLDVAIRTIAAWDLHYRGVAFVWVKTRRDGVPIGAQGVRPSVVKPLTEFVLVASTEPTGRPIAIADEAVVQTVLAPKGEHSRKPVEVIDRIGRLYPDVRKLEMFARGGPQRPLWDVWGNEAIAS
jgi:N6-adenosine-specific RNA methylase IME4